MILPNLPKMFREIAFAIQNIRSSMRIVRPSTVNVRRVAVGAEESDRALLSSNLL